MRPVGFLSAIVVQLICLHFLQVQTGLPAKHLWMTINAQKNFLGLSWTNASKFWDSFILLTNAPPTKFRTVRTQLKSHWVAENGIVVDNFEPDSPTNALSTTVQFDYDLSRNATVNTCCYAYWASYVDSLGNISETTCLRVYPRWMQQLQAHAKGLQLFNMFIPGTHNSGAYQYNFNPLLETKFTKYSLTQDDDIHGQLLHGARYLDIRVGYSENTTEKFFVYYGYKKRRVLSEIAQQVRTFVLESNEIVIFDVKGFSKNFGGRPDVHEMLVQFLENAFINVFVHPVATWSASLRYIWATGRNVILAYANKDVVKKFPDTLFDTVEHHWTKAKNWSDMENFLRKIHFMNPSAVQKKPAATMAVLIGNGQNNGVRERADEVNGRISKLYRDELGNRANIVAVNFIRGTNLVEHAIEWNNRRLGSIERTYREEHAGNGLTCPT